MKLQENADLTSYNTLRVPARAAKLVRLRSEKKLKELIKSGFFESDTLPLGDGSNLLFVKKNIGSAIKNEILGSEIVKETKETVLIKVSSGQNWHELVLFATKNNWSGLENMAYIPGTVGGAAVGNIAAYGQNQEDVFESLTAIDLKTGKLEKFLKSDCRFSYRESIFKRELKDKYFVTTVTYLLSKTPQYDVSYHSRYESLADELAKVATPPYSIHDIARAVTALRQYKLPDWNTVGTAGSFFKNPLVGKRQLKKLLNAIPELQYYPAEKLSYLPPDEMGNDSFQLKVPAGRLLEELGWKDKKIGNVGTFERHALVIINYGGTGREIYEFSEMMREDVKKNFGIDLEYEVRII